MRRFQSAFLAIIASAIAFASLAPEAAGQCTIAHTAVTGAWELCANEGSQWEWTGPNGFTSTMSCVTVSDPGTYTLRSFDDLTGVWSAPCSWSFDAPPAAPTCAISGIDSLCAGASTPWCGPDGAASWSWIGPSGALGETQCIDVSAAGEYSLMVSWPDGSSATCSQLLVVRDCNAPPPPSPPPSQPWSGCPLSARAWSQSCSGHDVAVSAQQFAQVASRVDERSSLLSYGGAADGLCALLRRNRHDGTDATRAKRQFAAVLANLSAAELGVVATDGHDVGLDANASIDGVLGVAAGTTVADWVTATEARLAVLDGAPARSRSARDEYRRITAQGRAIDRGTGSCATSLDALLDEDDDDVLGSASMSALQAGGVLGGTPRSDPLSGTTRLRWTLQRADAIELVIVDVTGRRIRHLASGVYSAGTHEFSWDGRDDDGRTQRAGAYFVAGRVGDQRLSQRLFLLR